MVGKLKSHDKNIVALCVCCGKLKGIFNSLRSKKCALYDIYIYKVNNQILGEFKFRFKTSEKKKYLYT